MSDLIERQAAIDAAALSAAEWDGMYVQDINGRIREALEKLPPAQPEITEEAVKEYCRKRCLCVVDGALLKKYASAQPEQRWIPCSERLPEIPCLVSDANHNTPYVLTSVITLEDKEHGKWAIDGRWLERTMVDGKKADMLIYHNRIVAWMPLPEPYKEGETT